MKLRFLAAAGPRPALDALGDRLGCAGADGLRSSLRASGLRVWTVPGAPVLTGEQGTALLIGMLFERRHGERLASLPSSEDLQSFVRSYWGPYVLIQGGEHGHSVLRDPSGGVPVYCARSGPLELYASDADLLGRALPAPFTPDLDFIRHWLSYPFLRTARTGASGVSEILPGAVRRVAGKAKTISQLWSPFDFIARDQAIASFARAAAMFRAALLHCVPRLVGANGPAALQLSGGLNSSLVAAALSHSGRPYWALTFATRSADGDERRYARAVAGSLGTELIELAEADAVFDLAQSAGNPLRPPPNPLLQPLHKAVSVALKERGAGMVVDGAGGDNLFASLNSGSPALDALRTAGVRTALRALQDLASVHDCSLRSAARAAARRARRPAAASWPQDSRFLARGALVAEPGDHPWLNAPASSLPGAAERIRMIVGVFHFLADPHPGEPAALHPLLAQPLVELCLRIPTWLWVTGGRDRAVAREAFRGLVPDLVLERRGKGSLESMFLRGYRAVRGELGPFLLDGALAAHELIDRDSVATYIGRGGEPGDRDYVRLLDMAAAEQWLRSFG